MKLLNKVYRPYFLLILAQSLLVSSCKKFIEVPLPSNQLTSEFVFTNDKAALQSITGIYSKMMETGQQFSSGYTTFFAGMSADELYYYTSSFRDEFIQNQISQINHGNIEFGFWNPCYSFIYAANKCIEGVESSNGLTSLVRQQVLGEAKFIRSLCYFYLVNLFGGVPLVLSTDYRNNQTLSKSSIDEIYIQIIKDLNEAKSVLTANYPTAERVRPNKFAVASLLARAYLFHKEWAKAETESSEVINSGIYSLEGNLANVFLINSNETIWQLRPVDGSRNTWEGNAIIPSSNTVTPTYLLTNSVMNDFELNDQRKSIWTQSRSFASQVLNYPVKYKVRTGSVLTECYVVLRLAEQYLIRSEARAQQNNFVGSQSDLNIIRTRASLLNTSAVSQASLLLAIEHERRIELFAEWGHRWLDLKRTNRADAVLGLLKPTSWQPTDILWPIPQNQINLNPSLTQNPGY